MIRDKARNKTDGEEKVKEGRESIVRMKRVETNMKKSITTLKK